MTEVTKWIDIQTEEEIKVVNKPWGRERWIAYDPDKLTYVLKIIEIKKGTKTSLQYHEKKNESNFLDKGEALLHFHDENGNLQTKKIGEGTVIHVKAPAVHRIEALTDIRLIEASTPEVDDVIRIEDDSNRSHGRIESEHK